MSDFPKHSTPPRPSVESQTSSKAKVKDACPAWADLLIQQLLGLEVRLGNIRLLGEEAEWFSQQLNDVLQRLDTDQLDSDSENTAAESLFNKIARGLKQEGHSGAAIAQFINARLTPEGRLRYCNAAEVDEAADTTF